MNSLYEELMNVIRVLESENIDYALCGGLALAIHAEPRFTKDIDLLILQDDVEKAKATLGKIGFDLSSGLLPFTESNGCRREIYRISKAIGQELYVLDLLLMNEQLESVWKEKEEYEIDGQRIKIVSKKGLIEMKKIAARPQDLLDIQKLEEASNEEEK